MLVVVKYSSRWVGGLSSFHFYSKQDDSAAIQGKLSCDVEVVLSLCQRQNKNSVHFTPGMILTAYKLQKALRSVAKL